MSRRLLAGIVGGGDLDHGQLSGQQAGIAVDDDVVRQCDERGMSVREAVKPNEHEGVIDRLERSLVVLMRLEDVSQIQIEDDLVSEYRAS